MPHPKPTDLDMTKHSDYFERTRQSAWLDAVTTPLMNSCVLKHLFLEGVEQPKILPGNPGNELSDALLMSRLKNFAADATNETTLRAALIN